MTHGYYFMHSFEICLVGNIIFFKKKNKLK